MKKKELVSIIVVTWNGINWLKCLLPTIYAQNYTPYEIILVDNASTDDSISWVKKKYPKVNIISLSGNEGYAEANNRGYEYSKGEYILFLNNDVEVTSDFLTNLIQSIEDDAAIGGAQSKILLLDDHTVLDTIGAFLTPTGFLYHYAFMNKDTKSLDRSINLYTPKGACMLFKRSALEAVLVQGNLFDPDMFAYFEETDMAHRIWLSGRRIVYAPKSVIYHKMGGTSSSMNGAFIQYHSFKNRIASYLKNISMEKLIFLLPIHIFFIQLYALFFLVKGKFMIALAIERAILWNVVHGADLVKKRTYIQKNIRNVPDGEFWDNIYRTPNLSYYFSFMTGKRYEEK